MVIYNMIMTGKVEINRDDLFTLNQHSTRRATKQVRRQSFAIRSVNNWNSLVVEAVAAKSVNELKNLLDKYWSERRYVSPFM